MFAVALQQAVSSEAVRAADFTRLAWVRAVRKECFLQGPRVTSVIGLVAAVPVSFATAAALAFKRAGHATLRDVVAAARRYRSFPLLSLPGALFDVLACSAAVFVISTGYGMRELGQFSQIQRFLGAPLLLVSASLFQVFLRQSADRYQAGQALLPSRPEGRTLGRRVGRSGHGCNRCRGEPYDRTPPWVTVACRSSFPDHRRRRTGRARVRVAVQFGSLHDRSPGPPVRLATCRTSRRRSLCFRSQRAG